MQLLCRLRAAVSSGYLNETGSSPVLRPMIITSKYPGRCQICQKPYHAGERVAWARNQPVRHAACSEEGQAVLAQVEASRAATSDVDVPSPEGKAYLGYQKAGIRLAFGR